MLSMVPSDYCGRERIAILLRKSGILSFIITRKHKATSNFISTNEFDGVHLIALCLLVTVRRHDYTVFGTHCTLVYYLNLHNSNTEELRYLQKMHGTPKTEIL